MKFIRYIRVLPLVAFPVMFILFSVYLMKAVDENDAKIEKGVKLITQFSDFTKALRDFEGLVDYDRENYSQDQLDSLRTTKLKHLLALSDTLKRGMYSSYNSNSFHYDLFKIDSVLYNTEKHIKHIHARDNSPGVAIYLEKSTRDNIESITQQVEAYVKEIRTRLGVVSNDMQKQWRQLYQMVLFSCGLAILTVILLFLYRQQQSALEESEKRTKQYLDALPIGVYVMDANNKPLYANEKSEELLGNGIDPSVDVKDLSKAYSIYISGTDNLYPVDELPIIRAINGEQAFADDIEIKKKEGRILLHVRGTPIYDQDGKLVSAIASFDDITEIREAEKTISVKNKEISSSINYAKRIQKAILPDMAEIKAALPNSFILYKPKDVVSGDFYWFSKMDDTIFLAAVDCTGHGVPGAFMSLIGNDMLNSIVKDSPELEVSDMLEMLNYKVKKALYQGDNGQGLHDGMDIALCKINRKSGIVEFAGAYRPLYYFSGSELKESKGDRFSVGGRRKSNTTFTSHTIELQPDQTFYIFSDGYADQFGGNQSKKFSSRRLRELILSMQDKPMEIQKEILEVNFEAWKGDEEQTDDILVIGFTV